MYFKLYKTFYVHKSFMLFRYTVCTEMLYAFLKYRDIDISLYKEIFKNYGWICAVSCTSLTAFAHANCGMGAATLSLNPCCLGVYVRMKSSQMGGNCWYVLCPNSWFPGWAEGTEWMEIGLQSWPTWLLYSFINSFTAWIRPQGIGSYAVMGICEQDHLGQNPE